MADTMNKMLILLLLLIPCYADAGWGNQSPWEQTILKWAGYRHGWEGPASGYLFECDGNSTQACGWTITCDPDILKINWGDGTIESLTSGDLKTHTYAPAFSGTMRLKGNCTITQMVNQNTGGGFVVNLADLPSTLTRIDIRKGKLSGDIDDLPPTITTFLLTGNTNTISGYTGGRSWAADMSFAYLTPTLGGLDSDEMDDILTDLAATTWTGSKLVSLAGTNATPGVDGFDAIVDLIALGVTVTVNMPADILSGWDFTIGWSAYLGGAVISATVYKTDGLGGIITDVTPVTIGKTYFCHFAGTQISGTSSIKNSGGVTLAGLSSSDATFSKWGVFTATEVGLRLYRIGDPDSETTVTTLQLYLLD